MTGKLLRRLTLFLVGLFLLAPLIVVAGVSVNEKQDLAFPPKGFSLSWYGEIFANPEWRAALVASIVLALSAAAIAVAIALPLAWFLWRRHAPWARVFQLLGVAPFILPPVITALGFLTFWATLGFYGQPWTAAISHAIFFVTLPLVTLSLGFASIDRSLVEAAATMGADDRTVAAHRRPAVDPALSGLRLRLRLRAVAQRVHRRLHDGRLHHGNAADQDLQRAALWLHADHGLGDHPLRRHRRVGLRPHRPLRRPAAAARRHVLG